MRNNLWKILIVVGLLPLTSFAAREAKLRTDDTGEMEAQRLLDQSQEFLQAKETERGVKGLERVLEQYPKSRVRYTAFLALGRYYVGIRDIAKAIGYLANIKALDQMDSTELSVADREIYLEGLYLMGVAYFQMHQYSTAFPILRKITNDYPNTIWANQAYYYIGMCHFTQQNWGKAIEALSMVGTFVDPNSPTVQYIEAGRRFYVKVRDIDLPVLTNLGKPVTVTVETTHGDKENIDCVPLSLGSDVYIGSIPTEIGLAKPGDRILQVIGGDSITTRYIDANDESGKINVPRESKVKVVSSGAINFTLGDYETRAAAVFFDQPMFIVLQDADLDVSDAADTTTVTVISRYRDEDETDATTQGVTADKFLNADKKPLKARDQVTVKLTEIGVPPVHTGRFTGKLTIASAEAGKPVDQSDQVLTCGSDDEIVVSYTDERHIGGETPRLVEAALKIGGEIDNRPRASQDVVADPVIKARKNLVEATAFLELARIYQSMGLIQNVGLMAGAKAKADDGLKRVEFVIHANKAVPVALQQDAFKLKWELHLAAEDYESAMATCATFNRLFPDSPFADQALMGIGKIRMDNKQYKDALVVFNQVLKLPKSQAKAEAAFRIAQATELQSGPEHKEAAVQQYKSCAERYPDSEFAGASLAKLVDYYVDTKDYSQANSLLEQVFQDHPDASFLDAMLLKWVLVAYKSGDVAKAYEKCSKLLLEYPESSYATKAKQIMPQIEARLKK